jgi:flagellar assembly protein FliH
MQSSFKVIKNNNINDNGSKVIETNCIETNYDEEKTEKIGLGNRVSPPIITNYENLANSILENARRQSEEILSNTYIKSLQIEKDAYEKAYAKAYEAGEKQAYSDSYDRAYEEYVIKAQQEAQDILNKADEIAKFADNMLLNSKYEYEKYFEEKQADIKELILEISRNILQREVKAEDAINKMVLHALEQVKTVQTYVIKCNKLHVDELKIAIELWQKQLTYKCEAFVIEDGTIKPGNAVVEKDNGHIEVGIDIGFNRLKMILEENDL